MKEFLKLDPILLEILGHQFRAATEEMGIALSRTARTTYVREAADFGTALGTPDGKFFAYPAALGVSGFLDLDASKALKATTPLYPGDVIITNHPYDSGGLSSHMHELRFNSRNDERGIYCRQGLSLERSPFRHFF